MLGQVGISLRNKYSPPEEVIIKREDELHIRNLVKNLLAGQPEHYSRILGDCLRAFAVTGEHDEALYRLIWLLKLGIFKWSSVDSAEKPKRQYLFFIFPSLWVWGLKFNPIF